MALALGRILFPIYSNCFFAKISAFTSVLRFVPVAWRGMGDSREAGAGRGAAIAPLLCCFRPPSHKCVDYPDIGGGRAGPSLVFAVVLLANTLLLFGEAHLLRSVPCVLPSVTPGRNGRGALPLPSQTASPRTCVARSVLTSAFQRLYYRVRRCTVYHPDGTANMRGEQVHTRPASRRPHGVYTLDATSTVGSLDAHT